MKWIGILFAVAIALARPAAAQVDLTGEWGNRYHEDYWHRQAGPEIGDYAGLPINDEGRAKAESWKQAVIAEPERQCIPHVATYFVRGPANFRISKVTDPVTRQVVAYSMFPLHHSYRTIWLDGRPHPPEYAKHTWAGFSTGKWDGNVLVVTTTHIKMGWIQRNGVPVSDQSVMTEYFIRHEGYVTVVGIVDDPVFLAEPFIRTTDFVLETGLRIAGEYQCGPDQSADEATGWPHGFVPHNLPGTNEQIAEFMTKHNVPAVAQRGGPETMYPDFLEKMKQAAAAAPKAAAAIARGADPLMGEWLLNRAKSTFSVTVPAKRVMKYEPAGGGIHHIIDTRPMANDSGYDRVEYTVTFDGADHPITGSALETVSLKRIDPRTVERTGKIKGLVVETATMKVSADGNLLTMTTRGTVSGIAYNSTQVFERQE